MASIAPEYAAHTLNGEDTHGDTVLGWPYMSCLTRFSFYPHCLHCYWLCFPSCYIWGPVAATVTGGATGVLGDVHAKGAGGFPATLVTVSIINSQQTWPCCVSATGWKKKRGQDSEVCVPRPVQQVQHCHGDLGISALHRGCSHMDLTCSAALGMVCPHSPTIPPCPGSSSQLLLHYLFSLQELLWCP